MNERMVKLARLSVLLALATVIHTLEGLLPLTVAWFKFGFANIIGLAALELYGFKDALLVTLGRIFLGSLAYGLFGSPAFALSLSGGVAAIVAMAAMQRLGGALFSEVGISIVGAVVHNVVQLAVAYLLLVRNEALVLLLPLMLLTAAGTGFVNGLASRIFIDHFKKATGAAT
jgi:heptaprenyl diphosphate synthase